MGESWDYYTRAQISLHDPFFSSPSAIAFAVGEWIRGEFCDDPRIFDVDGFVADNVRSRWDDNYRIYVYVITRMPWETTDTYFRDVHSGAIVRALNECDDDAEYIGTHVELTDMLYGNHCGFCNAETFSRGCTFQYDETESVRENAERADEHGLIVVVR